MARPRSEAANRAAIDATVDLLVEGGIEAVSMEEVAARSGVAKSTLYRHFGGREELVAAAALVCQVTYPTPDTGSLAGDLRSVFDAHQASHEEAQLNDLLPILLDAARREPSYEALVEDLLENRRRPVRTVIQLAQLRGEVDPDLDLDSAVALAIGPFTYRKMVLRQPVTPEFAELVLQSAVTALRATVEEPVATVRP